MRGLIAVIPARGGSKRIPRKNIRTFFGKPMIAWPIKAAQAAGFFERIIVSTDDAEIAQVAREWGAETPFQRPAELASDEADAGAVIAHATRWATKEGEVSAVCCILATAPFIQVRDLEDGCHSIKSGRWEFVFAATDYAAPIFRAFRQSSNGGVEMFFPEHYASRSQDLPRALHDAAQFYWGRPSAWLEGKRVFERHSAAVLVPRWRVQDIDTEEEWVRAELMAPLILNNPGQPPATAVANPG
jgi:N-acylneuraminate cytidylyltransferase